MKERFKNLEKGFYPVMLDSGAWEVMIWDGEEFRDTISGQYNTCEISEYVTSIGPKIELPPAYKRCIKCGAAVEKEHWKDMTTDMDGCEVCFDCRQ